MRLAVLAWLFVSAVAAPLTLPSPLGGEGRVRGADSESAGSKPAATGRAAALRVEPARVVLDSPETTQQLLVTEGPPTAPVDWTRVASFKILDPSIATIDASGLLIPRGEGRTEVIVSHNGELARVAVEVTGLRKPLPISFVSQVVPILTKAGCNAGGCHGKAEGQAGFKLSVFGFDPEADFRAIVMEGRGRRTFPGAPAQSLVLRKGSGLIPHGGGRRIQPDSLQYRRVLRWLAEGQRFDAPAAPELERVEVEPSQRVLALGGSQQLRVTAVDVRGGRHCVTTEAEYESNATVIAGVDRRGLVQAGSLPGEAAILVRYRGHVTVCRITIPRPGVGFARPPENNFIDRHVWDKLQRLGIPPSDQCDDATFLRRAFLDVIGTLPTSAEARAFLADKRSDKRARLVDHLLGRPEYADYWAMRWADILRVDKDAVTAQGAVAMTRWLRRQFAANRPYDALARDILTVQGSTWTTGPAAFYKVLNTPELVSRSVSQVFLGVRIECAQCHHHPSEKWSQDDYFALAGLFTGVQRKKLPSGAEAIFARGGVDLNHPRTGKPIRAKPLGATATDLARVTDRRRVLAEWMTAADNPYFAAALANRLWAHYFGRGLVEPLDDLRATNPATNEALLADLAKHLRDVKYDVKAFTRTLLLSRAYQLGPATAANRDDEQNFSHARPKALPAEVLLDALCQATGVREKFNGWPTGYRAIQVWDNRMPSYFFRIFGRPVRYSVCECERSNEPSITQALHLMNSPEVGGKIRARRGTARRLSESKKSPSEIVEELFLATLSRRPRARERELLLGAFTEEGVERRTAVEDVLWALLNTKEFIYNH
jgi:uncharacterized protein DUF1549/uncharacterized protein DUF1553